MRLLAFLLVIAGIAAVTAALLMDTSVATDAGTRVVSVQLMADKQIYTLGAAFVLIAGILLALFTRKQNDPAERP
jgi:phosphate/sulfate permease